MAKTQSLLADPWNPASERSPYKTLAAAGIGADSSHSAVREAFFALLEQGRVEDEANAAYNRLRIVSRRLMLDALDYDAAVAPELLAMLDEPPCEEAPEPPLHQRIPFSWDI